ncbi:MAG: DNA-formamidopyrimidine glycosylase family protein [Clostridiaceae bacterium]|nr:DNA-formamidopyrimidine glycosylase family protein [Clostridiaceae bacterium]
MIELPEAVVLAAQIRQLFTGKTVKSVEAAHSPHKFAWFYGDPQQYAGQLSGKKLVDAAGHGGLLEISFEDRTVVFGDGVNLRYHAADEKRPDKHQMLLEFSDRTALSASVQMYGELWCFPAGKFDHPYYKSAKEKPSPLTDLFNRTYYDSLLAVDKPDKMSVKAFLATEQRIPGLGNGVLQDILFYAGLHPRKSIHSLSAADHDRLFQAIRTTLDRMVSQGGRDTERNMLGQPGGYKTRLSKNTVHLPCTICGQIIKKEAFLGGSIYYCPGCQP